MSLIEKQYLQARNAWVTARNDYRRALDNMANRRKAGVMESDERGFRSKFNLAYNKYQPAAQRYLNALKAYTRERPELTGRLIYDYLREAQVAQQSHHNDVSARHLRSVAKLTVESVKVAHADWVRQGNKDTMAAVFTAVADAHMMNVDQNPEVRKIAQEVFDLFHEGKVKRDPKVLPGTKRPSVLPGTKRPSRGGPLWIERTINIGR